MPWPAFNALPADHRKNILKTRNILNLIGSKKPGQDPRKAFREEGLSA